MAWCAQPPLPLKNPRLSRRDAHAMAGSNQMTASTASAIKSSAAFRWTVGVGAGAIAALGLVLLFLLTQATGNRELYERNYGRLLVLNIVVATLLALVIGWIAVRLVLRLRKGRFGSRLLVKLAAIFALVGLLPGLMIYVVSYQFVSRSIESWFDVKVEGALDSGLNLGRAALDGLALELASKRGRQQAKFLTRQSQWPACRLSACVTSFPPLMWCCGVRRGKS